MLMGPAEATALAARWRMGPAAIDFGGGYWSPGAVLVDVSYGGDSTYAPSGAVVPVTMLNMFTVTAASSGVVCSGAAAGNTAALTVTPANGFTGPVYFACTIAIIRRERSIFPRARFRHR